LHEGPPFLTLKSVKDFSVEAFLLALEAIKAFCKIW